MVENQPRWPHCKRAINLLILNEIGYIIIANPKANHMYAMRTYFYSLTCASQVERSNPRSLVFTIKINELTGKQLSYVSIYK
jgi:hypothetical protein